MCRSVVQNYRMLLSISNGMLSELLKHAYTLFLFTKSDIKTTVVPITFFAVAAAPQLELAHLPHTIFWIWFHVLQFDVSNQTMSPEEDEQNKRDRPLPSRRITLQQALILRWALVPACFALSAFYSITTVYASIALCALTYIYDEMGSHSGHWLLRNVVNGLGFASFELGATLVASKNRQELDWVAIASICISTGIFITTIQTQDFKDVHGDKSIGRKTLPIVWPEYARHTVLAGLSLWSISLTFIWRLDWATAFAFITLAFFVSYRFLRYTSVPDDQVSFYWYNVWLSAAHALPGYYRLLA